MVTCISIFFCFHFKMYAGAHKTKLKFYFFPERRSLRSISYGAILQGIFHQEIRTFFFKFDYV